MQKYRTFYWMQVLLCNILAHKCFATFCSLESLKYLYIKLKLLSLLTDTFCSFFVSGLWRFLDKAHFQTGMLQDTLCAVFLYKETNEWRHQSVLTMRLLFALHFSLINTFNFFLSSLSCFFPSCCYRLVEYEGLALFVRYLESGGGGLLRGGEGKSVALTCLWQLDSMLVVTDSQLRWDVRGWEGRQEKNFEVSKRAFWQEQYWRLSFASRGAGLKISSAGRCPHPELSNLASRQCTYCHITLFPIKTWHAH